MANSERAGPPSPRPSPVAAATQPKPACGTCGHFWLHPDTAEALRSAPAGEAETYGHQLRRGTCRRYPAYVPHDREDWCGEWRA